MSIYYALERDIQNGHYNDISWTRMPEYNKMLYILKLAENNTFTCENNKGILSVKQLTREKIVILEKLFAVLIFKL